MARKRRGLTAEDQAAWDAYRKTTNRTAPAALQTAPAPDAKPLRLPEPTETPAPPPIAPFRIGEGAGGASKPHDLSPTIADQLRAAPVQMDAKQHRKMVRGKSQPEDRIDLHGMTLAEAHPELISFILTSAQRGLRLVLIITGKGKAKPAPGPIPSRVGVLRHQVPQWLRLPPLRQVVLHVEPAHRKHGGDGAYYVRLRR